MNIDDPPVSDNRNYNCSIFPYNDWEEFCVILNPIPSNLVLIFDAVMEHCFNNLEQKRLVTVKRIELIANKMQACRVKELDVIQGLIEEHLQFADNGHDYAIHDAAVQMMLYLEVPLDKVERIAEF